MNEKWAFLFNPNKKITPTGKKKRFKAFKRKYKELALAHAQILKKKSKQTSRNAQHKKVEATKLDKYADAKAETVKNKTKLHKQMSKKTKGRTPIRRTTYNPIALESFFMFLFGLLFFGVCCYGVVYIFIFRPAEKKEEAERQHQLDIQKSRENEAALNGDDIRLQRQINNALDSHIKPVKSSNKVTTAPVKRRQKSNVKRYKSNKPIQVERYNVGHNDDHFTMGRFWYEGRLWTSAAYYLYYGNYYTNTMYLSNVDRYHRDTWNQGDGDLMALEDDILDDIGDLEELREEAADIHAEAEHEELDSQHLAEDAEEIEDNINSLEENDPDDFTDEVEESDDLFEEEEEEYQEPEPEPEEEDTYEDDVSSDDAWDDGTEDE